MNEDGQRRCGYDLLSYPDITMSVLASVWPELHSLPKKVAEALEIEAAYAVYLERQTADIQSVQRDEDRRIPEDFDFSSVSGLSNELKLKLDRARPRNIAQAGKVDGMTPAALALIISLVKKRDQTRDMRVS